MGYLSGYEKRHQEKKILAYRKDRYNFVAMAIRLDGSNIIESNISVAVSFKSQSSADLFENTIRLIEPNTHIVRDCIDNTIEIIASKPIS